jgi:hypothetical protein
MDTYEHVMNVQYGGNHYKDRAIQPWEVWAAYNMDGWEASAVKYLLRYKDKGKPLEDLLKCKHNIEYLIAREERKLNNVQSQNEEGQSAQVIEAVVQQLQRGTECATEVLPTETPVAVGEWKPPLDG